jgi:hypothetical protein
MYNTSPREHTDTRMVVGMSLPWYIGVYAARQLEVYAEIQILPPSLTFPSYFHTYSSAASDICYQAYLYTYE